MSRDVMRVLAEARPAELDPDAPIDARTRAAELAKAMTAAHADRRVLPVRRRVRPLWGGGLGLVAVAAATALVIPSIGDGTPGRPAPGAPDGRSMLLAAAERAEAAPATGKYWRVTLLYVVPRKVGPKTRPYTVDSARVVEKWTTRNGAAWRGMRNAGAKPATAKDERAWRLDGSPTRWNLGAGDTPSGADIYLQAKPEAGELTKVSGRTELHVPIAGRAPSFDDLQRLPSDPAALRRLAEKRALFDGDDVSLQPVNEEMRRSFVAGKLIDLLTSAPVPPKVRAGAFRALADMPIVRSEGRAVDERGRPGVAFTTVVRYGSASTGTRLIIDPVTSRTTLYLGAGWTDQAPRAALP
jgi:hypothetical protein